MKENKTNIEVNEKELALLIALRTRFTFGEVVITMRDGVPQHIKTAWINDSLKAEDKQEVQQSEVL